jgi:hypothetical protein
VKSRSWLIFSAIVLTAIFSFIIVSCSNDNLGYTAPSPNSLDGGSDEVGPPDGGGDDPGFWSLNLVLDETEPVTSATNEKVVGSAGGSITVSVDGQNRTATFPSGFLLSDEIISMTVSKGVNKMGRNLEIYEFTPATIALEGAFTLGMQTDIKVPAETLTRSNFTLYKLEGDNYYEVTSGMPNTESVVEFELRGSMTYAVIYEANTTPTDYSMR